MPSILEEAQEIVHGARQGVYGHPRDDFAKIASLWNGWYDAKFPTGQPGVYKSPFNPEDVASLMILLKMARLMNTPNHRDSMVDMAGYAETMARVVGVDE